jgi:hypothetical protein
VLLEGGEGEGEGRGSRSERYKALGPNAEVKAKSSNHLACDFRNPELPSKYYAEVNSVLPAIPR